MDTHLFSHNPLAILRQQTMFYSIFCMGYFYGDQQSPLLPMPWSIVDSNDTEGCVYHKKLITVDEYLFTLL
jgi:hypothetical protein